MYNNTCMYVQICEAKKLAKKSSIKELDPYCVLKVDNEEVARTATVYHSVEPYWGEDYILHIPVEFQTVSVYVRHSESFGMSENIGKVMIDRESICETVKGLDKWLPLRPVKKNDGVSGEVLVAMTLEKVFTASDPATENNKYVLHVTVEEARDLAAKDANGKSDPYAHVKFQGHQQHTQVIHKTRFPRWQKTFSICCEGPLTVDSIVEVVIWDKDSFSQDDFMGRVEIDISELEVGIMYKNWYRLHQQLACEEAAKQQDLGCLRLRVHFSEERILESTAYTPLVDLMLLSVERQLPDEMCLLNLLNKVRVVDQNQLARTLVRFYLSHGSVLPLLDKLTTFELRNTTNPSTLFRGNSLASKCFDQFMKVVATPYLHATLKPCIDQIFDERKQCELDPGHLSHHRSKTLLSAAHSGSSSSITKILNSSAAALTRYVEMILNAIFSSATQCPSVLRVVLRQLWINTANQFKQPEHYEVPYLAVTSFIFLRFFVPAILSPKLFALRDYHADHRTERTLKLIAKVLQAIGNLAQEMDVKEEYMRSMSGLVKNNSERLKLFVQQLVQVDQKDVQAEIRRKSGEYMAHLKLMEGYLLKRKSKGGFGALGYCKRYFILNNISLLYSNSSDDTEEVKAIPIQWIRLVEKVDEGAFHRRHMFQIIVYPGNPLVELKCLYLQAENINQQNQWVSAIRKACLNNHSMLSIYHPGAFINKWSCCKSHDKYDHGCSAAHNSITLGDWRDPLDPDVDAQIIFAQFWIGKDEIKSLVAQNHDNCTSTLQPKNDRVFLSPSLSENSSTVSNEIAINRSSEYHEVDSNGHIPSVFVKGYTEHHEDTTDSAPQLGDVNMYEQLLVVIQQLEEEHSKASAPPSPIEIPQ
ncbi:rasGAP-activating-like protein 1 isoform X2 [Dysidea avara]